MFRKAPTVIVVRNFHRKTIKNHTDLNSIVKSIRDMDKKRLRKPKCIQKFSNFLIMDFEATCNRSGPKPNPQEIIEFPAINLSATTFKEISRFHSYVRPDVHPELSDFCTELTGIIQDMVNDQPNLKQVLERFETWLRDNNLNEHNTIPITYGDWDIGSALAAQCRYQSIEHPPVLRRWINLKMTINNIWGFWPRSLRHSVETAGLTFHGQAHSGIDDCVNIARLVKHLGEHNVELRATSELKEAPKSTVGTE